MKTLPLGKSSLVSSRLAFGCWRLAGTSEPVDMTPDREENGRQTILAAYEAGYTLFDLADVYGSGEAERVFGLALKQNPGMRNHIVIASKCGVRKQGDPHPDSPYRYDSSAEHIIRSCEQSLKRLGTEMIDLYLLHRPDYLTDPSEVAQAFSKLKESGKVREFGTSNFRPSHFAMLQTACAVPLIVNQVEISLLKLESLHDGTLDQCLAERITPMAWSPLASGRLGTQTPIDLRDPDHARRIHVRETLDHIARLYDVGRPVVALAWLMKHPSGILPIVGSTNGEKVRELAQASELELSREEWYRLLEAALHQRLP